MSGPNPSTPNSTSFFLVLPSNTQDYSTNTLHRFRVRLPKPILFRGGNWACALHSIQYPCSWPTTLGTFEPQWIDVHLQVEEDRKTFRINVPTGSFQSNAELLVSLRQCIVSEASRLDKEINERSRKRRYASVSHLTTAAKKQNKPTSEEKAEEEGRNGDAISDFFGPLPKAGEKNLAEEVLDEILGSPPRANSDEEEHDKEFGKNEKEVKTNNKSVSNEQGIEKTLARSTPSPPAVAESVHPPPPPPASIARPLPNFKSATNDPTPALPTSLDLPKTQQELETNTAEEIRKKLDEENAVDFPKYPIVPVQTAVRSPTRAEANADWSRRFVPVYAIDPVDDADDDVAEARGDGNEKILQDGIAAFFGKVAKMWEKNRADEFVDTFAGSDPASGPLARILQTISFEWLHLRDRLLTQLMHPTISHISMSKQLASVTGYGDTAARIVNDQVARYGIDLQGGFSSFAVSARGLTEEVIVGNRTSSLLRIMGIDSRKHPAGRCVERIFDTPLFLPIVPREISEVEIELHTLDGHYVPFHYGSVLVTLIFKKLDYK
jgi:hypothetical protein